MNCCPPASVGATSVARQCAGRSAALTVIASAARAAIARPASSSMHTTAVRARSAESGSNNDALASK